MDELSSTIYEARGLVSTSGEDQLQEYIGCHKQLIKVAELNDLTDEEEKAVLAAAKQERVDDIEEKSEAMNGEPPSEWADVVRDILEEMIDLLENVLNRLAVEKTKA